MVSLILPKNERNTLRIFQKPILSVFRSFFWKNPGLHNLLYYPIIMAHVRYSFLNYWLWPGFFSSVTLLKQHTELSFSTKALKGWQFKNGIWLPKLFWLTVRKNCSRDIQKLLKFEAEGREFAKFLRSLEQFIQTVIGQNNFW